MPPDPDLFRDGEHVRGARPRVAWRDAGGDTKVMALGRDGERPGRKLISAFVFTDTAMSPRTPAADAPPVVVSLAAGIRHALGDAIRTERRRRRWTLGELAAKCGLRGVDRSRP